MRIPTIATTTDSDSAAEPVKAFLTDQPSTASITDSSGVITSRVLQALEALDRHSFDRVDSSNSIDTLYSKIFPPINSSSGSKGSPPSELLTVEQASQVAKDDEPLVKLLCQWAVSEQRYGEHRAIAAALLLEKRQSDLVVSVEGDGATGSDDNDTEESTPSATLGAAESAPLWASIWAEWEWEECTIRATKWTTVRLTMTLKNCYRTSRKTSK